jgi:ElaB/YqjD/DUF883 family membrane-anchored ribosome-binding protein
MSTRNVEQEFDTLRSDFGKLSADLVGLTELLRDITGKGAQDYLAQLRAAGGQVNEDVHAAAAALGARGREGIAALGDEIKQRPLMSLLVCFALGLVLGKLIER